MLLPFFVANVIPLLLLADVVAMLAQVVAILVADAITTFGCWQMLLPFVY